PAPPATRPAPTRPTCRPASEMAREAIVRRLLLPVAVHAEPHAVIDGVLGDRHLREVAVAGGAVDARSNVRRVVEAHVRLAAEAVDALPRDLDPLVRVVGHLLNQRLVGGDLAVADHAGLDARDAGDRPALHRLVAVGALRLFLDVRLVRERKRLLA